MNNQAHKCIVCKDNPALAATSFVCVECFQRLTQNLSKKATLRYTWVYDALRIFNIPKSALALSGEPTASFSQYSESVPATYFGKVPFITIQGKFLSGKTSLGVSLMRKLYEMGKQSMYYCNLLNYTDALESAIMKKVLTDNTVVFFDNFGAEGVNPSYLAGILNSRASDMEKTTIFAIYGEKSMSRKIYFDSNIDQYLHIYAKNYPVITLN